MTIGKWVLFAYFALMTQFASANDEAAFAIANVRLFDGVQTHPQATVIVKGELIESVYLGENPTLPNGIEIIEGGGFTLLPGLFSAHSHVWQMSHLEDTLSFGVTTTLDMAYPIVGPANEMQATRGKKEFSHYADYYSAIISPTTPGGHGTEPEVGLEFPLISYPEEAPQFVADRVAEGSDYLKITVETGPVLKPLTSLPPATIKALIDEAHKHDLLAVAHINDPDIVSFAIDADIDGVVHVWKAVINGGARPEIAAAAKRKGVFFVPTLAAYKHLYNFNGEHAILNDPYLSARLSEEAKINLATPVPAEVTKIRAADHPSNDPAQAWKAMQDAARSLYEAGVTILVGADAANYGTWHGASVHHEMELLSEIGMKPEEILNAATAATADSFRLYDRGRVAPGKRADLLMVKGDPTTNILDTRKIYKIWKGGVEYKK